MKHLYKFALGTVAVFGLSATTAQANDFTSHHLVDEKPGALMDMHISTPHEVTPIGKDEQPKYSLALCWFPSSAGVA